MQRSRTYLAIHVAVWSLAGLIVVFGLVLGATTILLPGCSRCHDGAKFAAQTRSGSHANVDCTRCHVQTGIAERAVYGAHIVFSSLRLSSLGGETPAIPDATCLSCHANVMKKVASRNGLRIDHRQCAKGRVCIDCHSETAHGTAVTWPKTADMNQCLDCHSAEKVGADCSICHASRSQQERLRTGDWVATHGPNWKQTHGMGDWKTCAACHPTDYCSRCHGISLPHDPDFIRNHPVQALTNRKDCAVCHKQAFCDGCHGLEMPHPASFTPSHSSVVKKRGSKLCLKCHVQDDCDNCHDAHVHPGGAIVPPKSGAK